MAYEFPRYQSKGQLTTEQPSAFASQSTKAEQMQQVANAAGELQKVSGSLLKAYHDSQKSTAELNRKKLNADLLSRAETDGNYNDLDKYLTESQKIAEDSVKGIKNPFVAKEAKAHSAYDASVTASQLKNIFHKKLIDHEQAGTLEFIDMEVNNPTEASLQKIKTKLNQQVSAKFINETDAYKLLDRANRDLGMNRISKDLYMAQTPEDVEIVRQNITNGYYEQGGVVIDPEKKKSLLDVADRAQANTEKKVKAQAIEAQTRNRMEMILAISSNDPQAANIDTNAIAEYDPEFAGVITKVKDFMSNYNPKVPVQEQAFSAAGLSSTSEMMKMRNYTKSVRDVFLQNDNEQLGNFVLRELEKKGDGLTPSVKISAFTNLAYLKAKSNNPQSPDDNKAAARLKAIKAGVEFITASNPYMAVKGVGDFIVSNFLSGKETNEEVMQEAKTTLRDLILDRYKSAAKLPAIPNKIVDGDASVEDVSAGLNELPGEQFSGNYADQSPRE